MLVETIVAGVIVLFLLAVEAIDMAGRIDYVNDHFPRLLAWAQHRSWYRVLLLVTAAMVGSLWYETLSSQPQIITATIKAPLAPTIVQSAPTQVAREERRDELARLINRGVSIRDRISQTDAALSPGVKRDLDKWEMDVLAVLDRADAAAFNAYNIPDQPPKARIMQQIASLMEIAK
jgi:hypothetical protein